MTDNKLIEPVDALLEAKAWHEAAKLDTGGGCMTPAFIAGMKVDTAKQAVIDYVAQLTKPADSETKAPAAFMDESKPAQDGRVDAVARSIAAALDGMTEKYYTHAKAAIAALESLHPDGWRSDMESVPPHTEIMLYREDAGVFEGQYTYCAEWVSEEEQVEREYTEETLWAMDFWYFDHQGAHRLEGDMKPTHWRDLPTPPGKE